MEEVEEWEIIEEVRARMIFDPEKGVLDYAKRVIFPKKTTLEVEPKLSMLSPL